MLFWLLLWLTFVCVERTGVLSFTSTKSTKQLLRVRVSSKRKREEIRGKEDNFLLMPTAGNGSFVYRIDITMLSKRV